MKLRVVTAAFLSLGLSFFVGSCSYADTSGLWMSSSRQSITTRAGATTNAHVKVANKTELAMNVQLSVKSFTVNPETRAVSFVEPHQDWITPLTPSIQLAPSDEQDINYRIAVPSTADEKEYHFALIASTLIGNDHNTKTLRVASLLYLSVDGGHLTRASDITSVHVPSFAFGSSIPYTFAIRNTGDIHLQLRSSVQLQGQAWNSPTADQLAVVLPGESRTVSDAVVTPSLPGIYTLRYGYTDDTTGAKTLEVTPVIYIPLWFIGVSISLLLGGVWLWQRHHSNNTSTTSDR